MKEIRKKMQLYNLLLVPNFLNSCKSTIGNTYFLYSLFLTTLFFTLALTLDFYCEGQACFTIIIIIAICILIVKKGWGDQHGWMIIHTRTVLHRRDQSLLSELEKFLVIKPTFLSTELWLFLIVWPYSWLKLIWAFCLLRYYYHRRILEPVLGKKLVYRFGPNASPVWGETCPYRRQRNR